ncbi:FkbM family methyltransferase [Hymenobacter terricola]|uniref:FkbM family methyltransferase n=1 Tax=Hymenobacter terricola TaxID=2819236 RepID=UPI001B300FD0|nr:FkbM family methyltransferase [Hymenobacter terricola]
MRKLVIRVCNKVAHLLSVDSKVTAEAILSPQYIQSKRVEQWFKDDGDNTHRLNYRLNSDSLVWDLGGYEGQWASDIYAKYNCSMMIFEPFIPYAKNIQLRFENNNRINVFMFGLGARTETLAFSVLANSSSVFADGPKDEKIDIFSVEQFIADKAIKQVDLVKINIEGGEFELLESLLDTGLISLFKNVQVQFHDFIVDNAKGRMVDIQKRLALTHKLTYQYEFVWENWEILS